MGEAAPKGTEFEAVFAAYRDRIYRYCLRLCRGNREEAEDLAQDVFVQVYRKLPGFEGRSELVTWIYRITLHEFLERRGRRPGTLSVDEVEEARLGADPLPRVTDRLWLESALDQLTENQRESLLLYYGEGLKLREVAEVLGIPLGTVHSRMEQGLRRMRQLLAESGRVLPALAPGWWLRSSLREWLDVPAPPTLAQKVYRTLPRGAARSEPEPGRMAAPEQGRPAAPDRSAPWRQTRPGRLVTGVAGTLLVLLGISGARRLLERPRSAPEAPPAVAETLAAMERVRTAHATGVSVISTDGQARDRLRVEYWFKAPGSYRKSVRGEGVAGHTLTQELFVAGGSAVSRIARAGRTVTIPAAAGQVREALAPFAFFAPDGLLARTAEEGKATVARISGERGDREVYLLSVEGTRGAERFRWLLHVDQETRRVVRAEYVSEEPGRGSEQALLSDFEYDLSVPEPLLRLPEVGR